MSLDVQDISKDTERFKQLEKQRFRTIAEEHEFMRLQVK